MQRYKVENGIENVIIWDTSESIKHRFPKDQAVASFINEANLIYYYYPEKDYLDLLDKLCYAFIEGMIAYPTPNPTGETQGCQKEKTMVRVENQSFLIRNLNLICSRIGMKK